MTFDSGVFWNTNWMSSQESLNSLSGTFELLYCATGACTGGNMCAINLGTFKLTFKGLTQLGDGKRKRLWVREIERDCVHAYVFNKGCMVGLN